MPVIIKDYTWEETVSNVFITVPLKGIKKEKVDLFSTERYLKVHYPPYLFECFLFAPVHDEESAAEIGNGVVLFKLKKHEAVLWKQLNHPDSDDKSKLAQLRQSAIERSQERAEQRAKEKAEKTREQQQFAVQEQMRIEQAGRTKIEGDKQAELDQANQEIENWKKECKQQADLEKQQLLAQQEQEAERQQKPVARENNKSPVGSTEQRSRKSSKKKENSRDIFEEQAQGQSVRESGKISVTFSARVFPTAARESTAVEEEEWLKKQAENSRIQAFEDADLTEEEKNPTWLRNKGNDFFKAGNFQAAVNAYSHAIRLNYKSPALYNNRAACHLKLRNFFKCIEDSQRALELLNPPVPQNMANRIRAHVRRGTAFCQLEMYAEGLLDYEAALKLDPKNETLQQDASEIRAIIQGAPPSS